MEYRDYYETLGVQRTASADEIKAAYRKLARRYHPDVSKESDAEERFKQLGEAYEVLKDSEKRAAYDQLGANWKAGQDFRPPPGWDRQARGFRGFGGGGAGAGGPDAFSDFFSELFGGAARSGAGPRPGGSRAGAGPVSPPQVQKVSVTLEEAFNGTERQLRLTDSGQGGRSRTLNVRIPAGVIDGQKIRLAGQGAGGGDIHLEVNLAPDPHFRVEGRNVTTDLPVTPWEAALGATVQARTLGGMVDLRVPPGSQSGARMRLKGRGLGGSNKGDQYCVLKVVLPDATSDRARELYQEMARELAFDPRAAQETRR